MKVNDLMKILITMPQDVDVWVSSDNKGKEFKKVPDGWCTVEKFADGDLILQEDYDKYIDLEDVVLIG